MRRIAAAIIIILLITPAFAGDHQDIALSVGHQTYRWPERGISFSYGLNIGLTGRIEMDIWGVSELVPSPFGSNMFGLEIAFALMGARSTASSVAGSGINMLISAGGFYRTDNGGAGPVISYMDRGTIYPRRLTQWLEQLAAEAGIPTQKKTLIAGGNEARTVQTAGAGSEVMGISVACRYLHSQAVTASERDIEDTLRLVRLAVSRAGEL